jgi:DNA polymerase elongation subunit (family B)
METKNKGRQLTPIKAFKLIDFKMFDQKPKDLDSESDGSSEDEKKKKTDDSTFVIQMFGVNDKGETCSISVQDYKPFFYTKCGDNWNQLNADIFLIELQKKVGEMYKKSILLAELVEYNKLYGFTAGKKSKFIKITFKNTMIMNKVKYLWYDKYEKDKERKMIPIRSQNCNLILYESNLPPILRFFHIHNISPSGWISILRGNNRNKMNELKTTTCTYEYNCNAYEIIPQMNMETIVPYKICSFDIEASSSHGDFPIPIKTYKRLAANMIDVYFKQKRTIKSKASSIQLIEKIVYTAFGFDTFQDIDIVYPKKKNIVREEICVNLKNLFGRNIYDENDNTYVNSLMSIESVFDKYKDDEELCGGDDKPIDMEGSFNYKNTNKKTKKDKDKVSVIDLLNSYDGKNRDEKVQTINEILTSIFPEIEGDKVTFIGSTFVNYGETEPYLNHCLVLNSCDNVDGVVIETVKNESELLIKWAQLIQKENPDIIIGYNIFGFDYEFMFRRAQETSCEVDFLKLSRIKNEISAQRDIKTQKLSLENTKIVLSTGEYDLRYPKINGRLQIDMYTYFRRDFNLSSYKLDDVAGEYISDDIKFVINSQIDGKPITELYTNNIVGLHINDFIHIEIVDFTTDYYKNGSKFKVKNIIRDQYYQNKSYHVIIIDGNEDLTKLKNIKWCMAKDDVTPQDIFRLSNGTSSDRAIVAKYCIQDCNLVHQLFNKIDVITGYVEMSRICSVPISFLVFRGQGIKLTSYVAKKCREKNTLMPDLQKSFSQEGYEGALVLPPKCAMYMDNPVACVDYASLYPSSMISQNYSHDSKVWSKEYDLEGKLIKETGEKDSNNKNFIYDNLEHLGYTYIDIEFDSYQYLRDETKTTLNATKTKVGKKICRWVQLPNNEKSIMPSILTELLKARSDTKKLMKNTTDPFMQNILDKRQLGYKVTANSLYGQCGAKTSTFYEQDVAASTTATGRMMITYAQKVIEDVYGDLIYETKDHGPVKCLAEYVYGDTDSVFFTFNLKDPTTGQNIRGKKALEITIEIAQNAAKLCTQFLAPPMELSYEKTMMQFILLSKKRYVGILYETDPNKGKMKCMGLSLKRRDSCDYLKDTYGGILNILMEDPSQNNSNIEKAINFLDTSLKNLINGTVPMDKLSITKALRGYYKNPHQIAHNVLAERIGQRDPGNKPKSGERINFVHILINNKKALQGEKIETPAYIIQNKLSIDYTFYITHQLMKPIQQLFGLALDKIMMHQNKKSVVHDLQLSQLKKTSSLEVFMKLKEKICSDKVKSLLFDKYLQEIYNKENFIKQITSFYQKIE